MASLAALIRRAGRTSRPENGLAAIGAVREELEALERHHVATAIAEGWSWSRVAAALGVSKQAAHKKHARTVRALTSEIPDAPEARRRVVVEAEARAAVRAAREEAQRVGQKTVGTEHLLLGILRQGGSCTLKLERFGVTLDAARAVLQPTLAAEDRAVAVGSRETAEAAAATGMSPLARACLEQSLRETVSREDQHLGIEHLLLALLDRGDGGAARTLEQLGASPAEVRRTIAPV